MADNLNIPTDLAKVIEVDVKYHPELLLRFLTDLLSRITVLEKKALDFETRIKALE